MDRGTAGNHPRSLHHIAASIALVITAVTGERDRNHKVVLIIADKIQYYNKCIGRQFGRGGRDIGKKLAEELGIPFYDKFILSEALKETDLPTDLLEKSDEKTPHPMFRPIFYEGSNPRFYGKNNSEILFALQKDVILQKAAESSCVFVGRCADAILEKEPDLNVISVFIAASMKDRIERVMRREKFEGVGGCENCKNAIETGLWNSYMCKIES